MGLISDRSAIKDVATMAGSVTPQKWIKRKDSKKANAGRLSAFAFLLNLISVNKFFIIMTTAILSTTPDCEIVSSRIVNASRELVFSAWANPEHLKNWWGPAGFTNTFNKFDLRVGGKWSFIMHGPEKGHYPNECEFIKIEKTTLIAWQRISQPLFQVLATFEEVSKDKTKVVFKMLFNSAAEWNKLKPYVVDKNEENFDRLENELIKMK